MTGFRNDIGQCVNNFTHQWFCLINPKDGKVVTISNPDDVAVHWEVVRAPDWGVEVLARDWMGNITVKGI